MDAKYVAPDYLLDAFNCPHCGAYATQNWLKSAWLRGRGSSLQIGKNVKDIAISICQRCGESCVWIEDLDSLEPVTTGSGFLLPPELQAIVNIPKEATKGRLVYPASSPAPLPVDDLPEEIKADYLEARKIVNVSPRGAAALLRLCVQKLMSMIGEKGKNIDEDIASLVKKGLPIAVQQALDSLRVIGNEAVHPGTIDLNDDRETALALFHLLNLIVEKIITEPKQISAIYNKLPPSKLDAIAKRDKKHDS